MWAKGKKKKKEFHSGTGPLKGGFFEGFHSDTEVFERFIPVSGILENLGDRTWLLHESQSRSSKGIAVVESQSCWQ